MTKYYYEDFPPGEKMRLIRHRDNALIERYNFKNRKWIQDDEMLQIYTGDISVVSITEKEAQKIINE